jgi:tetratricopeptide (TPR) repeat protein
MTRHVKKILVSTSLLACLGVPSAFAQTSFKKNLKNQPAPNEIRAAELVSGAKRKLTNGQFVQAESDLLSARPLISDPLLRVLWNSLNVDLMEAKGNWAEAAFYGAATLREYTSLVGSEGKTSSLQWNFSVRGIFFKTLKNHMLAGLVVDSFVLFERRKNELSREMFSSDEEIILKKLADELRRIDRDQEAQVVEKLIFRNYPFLSLSLRESLTPDTICRLDEEINSAPDKKGRASGLVQRLGAREDIRNFVFSMMGLPAALKIIHSSIDSLSGQTRSELLDLVEWLHSVREYNFALDITNKLILSQNFEPPFTRDRLVMLHAKNLNGVHRPVEAAAFYRGLILQYPETDIANTARPRYVLSLHYAQKYVDVAREASSLAGLLRQRDVTWRTFWARYLSKQFSLALSATEHESGNEQRARFQYWRGRAYESDGLHREAKDVFKKIPHVDNASHYGLFASWRLDTSPVQPVSVQRAGVALAAKKLTQFDIGETAALKNKAKFSERYAMHETLIDAGLGDLMRGPLRKRLQTLGASGGELAEVLVAAGDAHASVQFASSQRKINGSVPMGRTKDWKVFLAKNTESMKLLYPSPYRIQVAEAAEKFGISPWLVLSIMRAESLFQPQVVSNVGARGLMQIMPTSGARIAELTGYPDFEPAHLDRPEVSIAFGALYLARLLTYYSGNLPLAIAAYNAGPEAIDRWLKRNSGMSLDEFLEDIPFEQTRKYVATVLTNMEAYSRIYSNGTKGVAVSLSATLPMPRNDLEIF